MGVVVFMVFFCGGGCGLGEVVVEWSVGFFGGLVEFCGCMCVF